MFEKKCDFAPPRTEILATGKDSFKDGACGVYDELTLIPAYLDNLPAGLIQDEL